jgi:uncharacterized protein (TIGR00369 family)
MPGVTDAVPFANMRNRRHGLLGYEVVEMKDGVSRLVWEPGEQLVNPIGYVHGGFVATVIDDACGSAIMSMLDRVQPFPTINMHIDFVRSIKVGARYYVSGKVLRMGRRVTLVDCVIENEDGELLARGALTFALDRPDVRSASETKAT